MKPGPLSIFLFSLTIWFTFLLVTHQVFALEPVQKSRVVDKVLVEKSNRHLFLISKGKIIKTYKIALGGCPKGHKRQQGDQKTPEGNYIVDYHNPNSKFHLALHISYPNAQDRKSAQKRHVLPGGDIMIHGIKNGLGWIGPLHTLIDWTNGCIAVTNSQIEEIYHLVDDGTPIEITP